MSLAPTMISMLLDHPDRPEADLTSLADDRVRRLCHSARNPANVVWPSWGATSLRDTG